MFAIRYEPPFTRDLEAIDDYLGRLSPRAAIYFLDEVDEVIDRLRRHPNCGPPDEDVGPGVRRIRVGSAHLIFYRNRHDTIVLLRLLHGAQDRAGLRL